MRRHSVLCAILLAPALASAHGVMTQPTPRPDIGGVQGFKLQPYASARTIANAGCGGGQNNQDPGVQRPVQAYAPGSQVTVQWKLTLPHNDDNLLEGIRVAIHYSATDSFSANILAGGAVGDPPYTKVSAGTPNAQPNSLHTTTVTLPLGKTCDICTLQWMWSAQGDGGSYIGCADISITANGQPPTPLPIPTAGEILPGVPGEVYVASPPYITPPGGGGGGYRAPPPPPVPSEEGGRPPESATACWPTATSRWRQHGRSWRATAHGTARTTRSSAIATATTR